MDTQSLILGLGGLVGALGRVAVDRTRTFPERQTFVDLGLGVAIGIVYPLYGQSILPLPQHGSVVQQAAIVALVSYFSGHVLQRILPASMFGKDNGGKP